MTLRLHKMIVEFIRERERETISNFFNDPLVLSMLDDFIFQIKKNE